MVIKNEKHSIHIDQSDIDSVNRAVTSQLLEREQPTRAAKRQEAGLHPGGSV